jgi:hypothetical protein
VRVRKIIVVRCSKIASRPYNSSEAVRNVLANTTDPDKLGVVRLCPLIRTVEIIEEKRCKQIPEVTTTGSAGIPIYFASHIQRL